MENKVYSGFSVVILIMMVLALFWLSKIEESNKRVLDLIQQFDTKIEHTFTVQSAVYRRYNLLLSMPFIEDPLAAGKKLTEFYELAAIYQKARAALHALPMDKEEKKLHELLDKILSASQKYNIQATEMFGAGAPENELVKVIKAARSHQDELLATLNRFVELQKSKDEKAVNYSSKIFADSIYWVSISGFFALLFSLLISRYVGRAVDKNNQQLVEANEDMAKAYKKAKESTIIKSEFLATMSHEIRTPLTAIIGFAETFLFSDQTIEQRQHATKIIIRSGHHLLQIINNILDLSKVEANKLNIEYIEFPFFDLLADVEYLVRPAAEEKGLGFSVNYIFPLPDEIESDSLRIKQVLINLCNNAIKFTESGYVTINVSCDNNKNILKFEIVDSGVGISKEQQDIIFKAYQQADTSITRKFGGTGLGLSLSKMLAERLGGSITVESELNKGSIFTFLLEVKIPDTASVIFDKEHLPKYHQTNLLSQGTKNLFGHILLAEDNEDNQQLLLIYLKRMGVDVTIVGTGKRAIKAVEENNFDLILMDMRMPVMGGLEATKLLRAQGFNKPVVVLTANARQEDRDACENIGCSDFLTKPVEVAKLYEILKKYLELKPPGDTASLSINSLLLNDAPEMIDLVKRYVDKLTDIILQIEKSVEENDWENLSGLSHQLKGSSGNFGYPVISSIAGKMEFQTINKNTDELILLISELKESHKQIVSGLKND